MNNIITFDKSILEKAKRLFYSVTVYTYNSVGNYVKSADNTGAFVRIYRTGWEYSEDENFYNNADLEKYVNDELADRVYFYQHELDYS